MDRQQQDHFLSATQGRAAQVARHFAVVGRDGRAQQLGDKQSAWGEAMGMTSGRELQRDSRAGFLSRGREVGVREERERVLQALLDRCFRGWQGFVCLQWMFGEIRVVLVRRFRQCETG